MVISQRSGFYLEVRGSYNQAITVDPLSGVGQVVIGVYLHST